MEAELGESGGVMMPPEPMTPERASHKDADGEGHQYALAGRTSMWTRAREGLIIGWGEDSRQVVDRRGM